MLLSCARRVSEARGMGLKGFIAITPTTRHRGEETTTERYREGVDGGCAEGCAELLRGL